MTGLRVCIYARHMGLSSGGTTQAVIGLATGLSELTDGNEEYLFLTTADAAQWIQPYVHGPCRILFGPEIQPPMWKQWMKSNLPVVAKWWRRLRPTVTQRTITVPRSDGTIERAGIDIMHFTMQSGFLTDVPSIYHPWDLQHLHLRQFFSRREYLFRETKYRTLCDQARMVAVATAWGKNDLIRHYGLPEDKVQVVPAAPVLTAYPHTTDDDLAAARIKFSLPETFAFYPAQTWAHKNHIGLLEALAILRDRHGLSLPLVCSGYLNDFFPKIERRARDLGLSREVQFLGFVTPLELQCLYNLCRCMVFPTKFEGLGMPLMEAFLAGVPVACSNVTSLPEQAGDAALIFDPERPEEIADAILRLWTNEALRNALVERGKRNVARFSWDRTARLFRAHYRRIAGRSLTDEDRDLLAAPSLL